MALSERRVFNLNTEKEVDGQREKEIRDLIS